MKGLYRVAYRDSLTHSKNKLVISKSECYKIYYFHEGEGGMRAFVNGALADLKPGDVLLVPKGAFTGTVKRDDAVYRRCVSYFPGELRDFLISVDPEVAEAISKSAVFRLDSDGIREYREIIDALGEKARRVEALDLILRQIKILMHTERVALGDGCGDRLVDNVISVIDEEGLTLGTAEEIAERVGYSKSYLYKRFKEKMDIGLHDFLIARKLFAALDMLSHGSSVTEVAYATGFSGASHFISVFRAHYGTTPKKYISQIIEN